jgi:hypothetical protein
MFRNSTPTLEVARGEQVGLTTPQPTGKATIGWAVNR